MAIEGPVAAALVLDSDLSFRSSASWTRNPLAKFVLLGDIVS